MLQNSPRHAAAVAYAKAGIPVFPCVVGGKTPATYHGFKNKTIDLSVIDDWWLTADYNLAVVPEDLGCFVVDIDSKHDGFGLWTRLTRAKDVPPTRAVLTPSGGLHLYFHGSLPPSSGRCGKGVDIRGRTSYVLVPPSIIGGVEYRLQT